MSDSCMHWEMTGSVVAQEAARVWSVGGGVGLARAEHRGRLGSVCPGAGHWSGMLLWLDEDAAEGCCTRLTAVLQRVGLTSSSLAVRSWPTPPVAPATNTVDPGSCSVSLKPL
jgi:hypothetical protein